MTTGRPLTPRKGPVQLIDGRSSKVCLSSLLATSEASWLGSTVECTFLNTAFLLRFTLCAFPPSSCELRIEACNNLDGPVRQKQNLSIWSLNSLLPSMDDHMTVLYHSGHFLRSSAEQVWNTRVCLPDQKLPAVLVELCVRHPFIQTKNLSWIGYVVQALCYITRRAI